VVRVLAVVAHPDDEVIGPGGTLARHARAGDDVAVLILAEGSTSRAAPEGHGGDPTAAIGASRQETAASAAALGLSRWHRLDLADNRLDRYPLLELAQQVAELVAEHDPQVVYTHHPGDLNLDHERTARACVIACRPQVSGVRWLFTFPTLSATEAGFAARPPFVPAVFVDITDTLPAKLAAMACYASELREPPHPRSLATLRAHAELTGATVGHPAAEAFGVVRGTWVPGRAVD